VLIQPLGASGVFGIKLSKFVDKRGSLTRIFDRVDELGKFNLGQASYVQNSGVGLLRGIHFQMSPDSETKLILCLSGQIFDVVVSLASVNLACPMVIENTIGEDCDYQGLLIPPGFAHGYMTLTSQSALVYFMDRDYVADSASGLLWSDPLLGIKWPHDPKIISLRDSSWPLITKQVQP